MAFPKYQRCIAAAVVILLSTAAATGSVTAQSMLEAAVLPAPIEVDGDIGDWAGVRSYQVPMSGEGGAAMVELRFATHGDMIYVLAVWADETENRLHKPYRWDDTTLSYRRTREMEDRLAISFAMSGDFSNNKVSGAEFTADVWHWKASRSDPAGIAHDKMWRVSHTEFKGGKKFTGPDGRPVYIARISDAGDRLYKPVKHETKREAIMPRYEVNLSPQGSVADVRAKGVWRDGHWYLEMARKLDTGHDDDVVIPAAGRILLAVAAFDNVDAERHSVSDTLVLHTGGYGN